MNTQNNILDTIRESVKFSIGYFSPKDAVDSKVTDRIWFTVYASTCEPVWNAIKDYEHHIKQHISS
jgi:hypothetical protein